MQLAFRVEERSHTRLAQDSATREDLAGARHVAVGRSLLQSSVHGCACGGSCPRCQTKSNLQIGQPGDAYEQEADAVADRVLRMPGGAHALTPAARGLQRKCDACEKEDEERLLQPTKESSNAVTRSDVSIPSGHVREVLNSPGQALASDARAFFEARFGRDFGNVRIHTDTAAQAAARGVNARAFTVGRDVAFAAGEYEPRSARGSSLLAHELAHVVQQAEGAVRIQRKLSVNSTPPTDLQDPLSAMGPAPFQSLAFSEMDHVIHSLCEGFSVDAAGDVISSPTDACDNSDAVAGGAKPAGCCCLCALTAIGSGAWKINVTGIGGPRTVPKSPSGGEFFLHPRTSSFEFGTWDVAGTRATADAALVAGHELCGHGALFERGIHPTNVERVDTNVHDATVRVENLIRAEQGFPGADRALATGPHRGESFARITVRNYAFNSGAVPAAEANKVQLAKDFINANDTWVDIFGHSDHAGSAAAKLSVSWSRANSMKTALTTGTGRVSPTISKTFSGTGAAGGGTITVSGSRFTRVEGRSDFDAMPGAAASALRRVDIVMATRPAGAEVPNPATPAGVAPVGPQSAFTFLQRRFLGNACDQLLARSAWF